MKMSVLLSIAVIASLSLPLCSFAAPALQATLPANQMTSLYAPDTPENLATTPKRLRQYYLQSMPYLMTAQFTVTPGQKYTLYECQPAPADSGSGTKISVWASGITPLSDNASSFGPSSGVLRGFATRGQSPWAIRADEGVNCDLYRHNFTIAADSEHSSLFIVATFSRPGLSTQVMLKHPADPDDDVKKSSSRSKGTVWKNPLILLNIPGEKAPVKNLKPTVQNSGVQQLSEAPATASNEYPLLEYPCRVQAYIHRGDYDTFRFKFQGGMLRIESQGGLDIVADLWDDKGNRLYRAGEDSKADFIMEKELPSGIYFIQVRYMRHGGEGTYALIFGNGTGSVYQEKNSVLR
jgi:hypothetical protein